jgi:hypothetical protein
MIKSHNAKIMNKKFLHAWFFPFFVFSYAEPSFYLQFKRSLLYRSVRYAVPHFAVRGTVPYRKLLYRAVRYAVPYRYGIPYRSSYFALYHTAYRVP